MGSTESTGRSNQTEEEEQQQSPPENSSSGGGGGASMGAATAVALAAAGTAMAAWGISRMISNSERKEKDDAMKIKAHETESSFPNLHIYESIQYESKEPATTIWSPPPVGRFKMNTDGKCNGTKQSDGVERGPSGYAGILRNHRGEWVRGFLGFISLTDIFTAEIYGIYIGLKLLDKPEYNGSILETDHHGAFVLLNKPAEYIDKRSIIEESRRLARKYNISIEYKPRSANRCADRLANMAVDKREKYLDLEKCPQDYELKSRYDQDLESCN